MKVNKRMITKTYLPVEIVRILRSHREMWMHQKGTMGEKALVNIIFSTLIGEFEDD